MSCAELAASSRSSRFRTLVIRSSLEGPARPFRREFPRLRSEEHTSELQSLMRISYAVFCLKKKIKTQASRDNYKQQKHTQNKTNEHHKNEQKKTQTSTISNT